MKIVLDINNQSGCNFSKKKIKLAVEETVLKTGVNELFAKELSVSLGMVSSLEIKKLNSKYRKKDSSTDILSFSNYEKQSNILREKNSSVFLGELIICCEDIDNYSREKGIPFEEEIIRVGSHGILHLLGFSHGKKMFSIQDAVVKKLHKK